MNNLLDKIHDALAIVACSMFNLQLHFDTSHWYTANQAMDITLNIRSTV